MIRVIPQTREVKIAMYMKLTKRELAEMLAGANEHVDRLSRQPAQWYPPLAAEIYFAAHDGNNDLATNAKHLRRLTMSRQAGGTGPHSAFYVWLYKWWPGAAVARSQALGVWGG